MTYPNTQLFINGQWQDASEGKTLSVVNPATGLEIGKVAHASRSDLDAALAAAQKGFETWRNMTAQERGKIMRKAAGLLRERATDIAGVLTQEQGKPLGEAKAEVLAGADMLDWFAEEGSRT
jgi:succinate-semialdehyde dehydrogenase/glutarate-semialdehyde dehydrogenase